MITFNRQRLEEKIAQLDYSHPTFQSMYGDILNTLQDIDYPELKNELIKFASKYNLDDIAKVIPPQRVTVEGKIAFCVNRGANLSADSLERVKNFIERWRPVYEETQDAQFEDPKILQKIKINNALIVCRTLISQAMNQCALMQMNHRDLASYVRETVKKYSLNKTVIVKDLEQDFQQMIIDSKDDEHATNWLKPLRIITETLGLISNNRKAVKYSRGRAKARKFSVSSAEPFDRKGEKAAAKISFKEEDDKLGIRSIDPTNIVGADTAVIYNTKNKHCEIYRAKEGLKLSVQGARITNFDNNTSVGKTLRKPERDLPHWTRATSIRRIEILMQDINGKAWAPTGKMNKHCIIIKVI
jgi:hypothetical protein